MPTDPNARRDQKLDGILGALKETNKLLKAQNDLLAKMERAGRVQVFQQHPYLERSSGPYGREPGDQGGDAGTTGSLQGGDPDSAR